MVKRGGRGTASGYVPARECGFETRRELTPIRLPFLLRNIRFAAAQAFKSHSPTPPFLAPGTADLTANVDFEYLVSLLPKPTSSPSALRVLGPISQAQFLHSMGLGPRVQRLVDGEPTEQGKEEVWRGARRLVAGRGKEEGGEEGMGEQYLVMGLESGGVEEAEVYPFLDGQGKEK